jgi:hypothetical protein
MRLMNWLQNTMSLVLILLNKGEIVSQQVGAASKESYQSMIDRALA